MINTGYIILAGQALKAVYVLFRDDHVLKLPYFIGIAGFTCALFAFAIPHLSALRIWLGVSTFLSLIYIGVAIVLGLKDGMNASAKDYSIPGSMARSLVLLVDLQISFSHLIQECFQRYRWGEG